jgi:flagellar assembly factor FliW
VTSYESVTVQKLDEPRACDLPSREFYFPAGILGFPTCRRYKLERFQPADGSESPFLILAALDQELCFPVIHPESMKLDYRVPVSAELLAALGAKSQDELVPLLIVTVRDRVEAITVNLQGPVMLNPHSSLGTQLIMENYPLRHPLLKRV